MRKSAGFTLMELMVTLSIAGVLFAVAAPQLGNFNENMQIRSAANNFQSMVQLARTEAIKRNRRVYLDNTSNGDNWGGQFQICIDHHPLANDGCIQGDAEFVRDVDIGQSNINILSSDEGIDRIFFNTRGRLENSQISMAFCDDRGADGSAQFMTISATGRPSFEKFDDGNGAHVCDP